MSGTKFQRLKKGIFESNQKLKDLRSEWNILKLIQRAVEALSSTGFIPSF